MRSSTKVLHSLTSKIDEIVVLQTADSLQLTTDVVLASGAEEVLDGRVKLIIAAEDLLGLENPMRSSVSFTTRKAAFFFFGCEIRAG